MEGKREVVLFDSNTPAAQRAREGAFRVSLAARVLQGLSDSVPEWHAQMVAVGRTFGS